MTTPRYLAFLTLFLPILGTPCVLGAHPTPSASDPKVWVDTVDRAIEYLRRTQAPDGSWSADRSPGVTGIVLTGLMQTGRVSASDPMVAKAIRYVESLVNRKAGHIAGPDPKPQLMNYVTSINVLALTSTDREAYKAVVADAAAFLKNLQWDEGEGKDPKSDFYGGAGYDSKSRPDLSNTQFFIDALIAAGVSKDDPALKKALLFVSRCQNRPGEQNDQPWAGKIKDGSFIYSAAAGGSTKVQDDPGAQGELPGYGSMTYAGIKSMIYCGATKDDPRVQKAMEWIRKNYTVERNPGMPEVRSRWGLYYYYHTMAKCFQVLGMDEVVDANGKAHDWRADITGALAKQQRSDGSWVNPADRWMEGDPNLITGYALMTLGHCKPKK